MIKLPRVRAWYGEGLTNGTGLEGGQPQRHSSNEPLHSRIECCITHSFTSKE